MRFEIKEVKTPNIDYCFYDEDTIFYLEIQKDTEIVGTISVHKHPEDKTGGQVGIEIEKKWRKKWLSRSIVKNIMTKLIEVSRRYELSILYSVALSDISPRLLEFFGFKEYYLRIPKTYYYIQFAR